jgi:hypothetical protein
MYTEQINKIKEALPSGRYDVVQMLLSTLLLTNKGGLNEAAKNELLAAIPGSRVVFGSGVGGLRAGYLLVDGERYYFA